MDLFLASTQSLLKENTWSIELIISLFAIIISIVTLIVELYFSNRNNKLNLEAHFFTEIFDIYLLEKIPNKRKGMTRDSETGEIIGIDELSDVLIELRQEAIYYKFKDKKFYNKLFQTIRDIEDNLIDYGNRKYDEESYDEVKKDINDKIEKLYSCIMNKYIGKKDIKIKK